MRHGIVFMIFDLSVCFADVIYQQRRSLAKIASF